MQKKEVKKNPDIKIENIKIHRFRLWLNLMRFLGIFTLINANILLIILELILIGVI